MATKALKAKAAEPRPAPSSGGRKPRPTAADPQMKPETAPGWARQVGFGTGPQLASAGGTAGGDDAPGPFGVLVEDGALPGPGQMARKAFMNRLEERVRAVADEELAPVGRTAKDCPYLEAWLAFYRTKPAGHIERAIRHYASGPRPTSEALAAAVEARVRVAVRRWRETGELSGISGQSPLLALAATTGDAPPLLRQSASDALPPPGDPVATAARLGPGTPLDAGVRSRMERGMGGDLRRVRVHTDATGAALARHNDARAFAVGEHVAFAEGTYRPGTLAGDALLAHELAHTVQQRSRARSRLAGTDSPSLERDAVRSASASTRLLWHGAHAPQDSLQALARAEARPRLSSGLVLQRCRNGGKAEKGVRIPDAEPAPTPEPTETMARFIGDLLADGTLDPKDWAAISKRATELRLGGFDLPDIFRDSLGFESSEAKLAAELATTTSAALRTFVKSYTTTVSGSPKVLTNDPVEAYITDILKDSSLDASEFDGLRALYLATSADRLRAALGKAGITSDAINQVLKVMDVGVFDFRRLLTDKTVFPIKITAGPGGAKSLQWDLTSVLLKVFLSDLRLMVSELSSIRMLVGTSARADTVIRTFQSAGVGEASAKLIAAEITRRDFEHWVTKRSGLALVFERAATGLELTDAAKTSLALPWHPAAITPLAPIGGKPATGEYKDMGTGAEDIGDYPFASGKKELASRFTFRFRGMTVRIIIAESLITAGWDFDRTDAALSVIPVRFIKLLKELVIDPGNRADARDADTLAGRVNMYLQGYSTAVAQSELNNTTAHEFGHLVHQEETRKDPQFMDKWRKAMEADAVGISRYGFTNDNEDFAESFMLYLAGGSDNAATRKRYAKRWAILDEVFKAR